MTTAELYLSPPSLALSQTRGRRRSAFAVATWILAAALPLVGLVSLLLRDQLDLGWHNHAVHFTLFLTVGAGVFVLAYAAGEAANRRGDARVLLISLAFLATGGFLGLHAVGTAGDPLRARICGVQGRESDRPRPRRRVRPRVRLRRSPPLVRAARGATPRCAAPCRVGGLGACGSYGRSSSCRRWTSPAARAARTACLPCWPASAPSPTPSPPLATGTSIAGGSPYCRPA